MVRPMLWAVLLGTALAGADKHHIQAKEDPLAYKAWSFVRSVSSELGGQAQGILNVQNSLEAVELNYTTEQDKWDRDRVAKLQDRTALEAQLARAKALQREAQTYQSQAQSLQTKVVAERGVKADIVSATCAEETARVRSRAANAATVAGLSSRLTGAQAVAAAAQSAQFAALRTTRQSVADLESQVYALVQLLRTQQQAQAQRAAVRAQGQADLLKGNIAQQQSNTHLEAQLLSATSQVANVKHLEQQQAVLAQQTKFIAARVLSEKQSCDSEVKDLENQVRAIQSEYAQQANGIRQCQAADAEGQRLTAQLAGCR